MISELDRKLLEDLKKIVKTQIGSEYVTPPDYEQAHIQLDDRIISELHKLGYWESARYFYSIAKGHSLD